jgi:hypothetical protein
MCFQNTLTLGSDADALLSGWEHLNKVCTCNRTAFSGLVTLARSPSNTTYPTKHAKRVNPESTNVPSSHFSLLVSTWSGGVTKCSARVHSRTLAKSSGKKLFYHTNTIKPTITNPINPTNPAKNTNPTYVT